MVNSTGVSGKFIISSSCCFGMQFSIETIESDKVYQLLAHGQWFSPDTPASSTSKTSHP
jgi:hypothetical protein